MSTTRYILSRFARAVAFIGREGMEEEKVKIRKK